MFVVFCEFRLLMTVHFCLAAVILFLPIFQSTLYDNTSLQFFIKITVQNTFNFVYSYMAIPDFQGMN
jgi:hypothetical protein